MTAIPRPGSRPALYFFLSYARIPTIEATSPDPLVGSFFADLSRHVAQTADEPTSHPVGLYDRSEVVGSDVDAAVVYALRTAEVLVPLYSPGYLADNSWPMVERRAFQRRLSTVRGDTTGHIQPVLWMPLPPGVSPPRDHVQDLAPDLPPYAELGLGVLCDLPQYRDLYQEIVDRLAQRIVAVAQDSPIGPSLVEPMVGRPDVAPGSADFIVAVLAGTTVSPPPGRDIAVYGNADNDWAPLVRARPLPIARQIAGVAERLNLLTSVVDFAASRDALLNRPSILLIDPWLLATEGGAGRIERAVAQLPDWATAMVVADTDDTQHGERGADLQRDTAALLADSPGQQLMVEHYEQFLKVIPGAIMNARKRFLHSMPAAHRPRKRLGFPPRQRRPEGDGHE